MEPRWSYRDAGGGRGRDGAGRDRYWRRKGMVYFRHHSGLRPRQRVELQAQRSEALMRLREVDDRLEDLARGPVKTSV